MCIEREDEFGVVLKERNEFGVVTSREDYINRSIEVYDIHTSLKNSKLNTLHDTTRH